MTISGGEDRSRIHVRRDNRIVRFCRGTKHRRPGKDRGSESKAATSVPPGFAAIKLHERLTRLISRSSTLCPERRMDAFEESHLLREKPRWKCDDSLFSCVSFFSLPACPSAGPCSCGRGHGGCSRPREWQRIPPCCFERFRGPFDRSLCSLIR